ncbi:hypothetical protein ACIBEJ_51715 [Nonomuraea sp. NPDC050790]|uniref:hypothetical protein n=1 Tax=Nonomuraea sp. NPDC050790 TaxID=3364371 RepID=UPI003793AE10
MQAGGQHGQGLQAASSAYTAWLTGTAEAAGHDNAFTDTVGAEAAVTGWRRHLVQGKASPASINQALAAVKLLYAQSGLRIEVNPPGCPGRASPTPSPPRSRAASSAPPPAAAPATGRSWRRCCTAAPASRNALACRWPTCS